MNVHLSPELEELVQRKMESGRYQSADDVVREALQLLDYHDEVVAVRKDGIREQIEEGWRSAKNGELIDGDEFFDQVDAELKALERSAPK